MATSDVDTLGAALRRVSLSAVLPMIRSVFVVGIGSVFGYASTFLRGVLLARILGPSEFGLAIILLSISGALDLFADAGIDRFIVQHRFGSRADMMRTSHAFRIGGSTVVGAAIAILAYPLAHLFKAPNLAIPIMLTGGVVVLRGCVNLSYKLQQRDHRFERETIIDIVRNSADLIACAVIALTTHSYLAVLVGLYVNTFAQLIMAMVLADQPYRAWPRWRLVGLVGRFSTPIYINAALLFAAAQGDRMVVAAMFSKEQLAFYAASCAIGQGLIGIANRMTMSIMLPMLSPRDQTLEARRRLTNGLGAFMIVTSLVFLAGMALLGPFAVRFIYGPAYGGLTNIIFASAIVQMIQFEQGFLTTLLMANGRTKLFPLITGVRAAAFPAALAFVSMGWSLISIPLAFALGATFSLVMSYYAARPLGVVDRRLILVSFGRIALATAAIGVLAINH